MATNTNDWLHALLISACGLRLEDCICKGMAIGIRFEPPNMCNSISILIEFEHYLILNLNFILNLTKLSYVIGLIDFCLDFGLDDMCSLLLYRPTSVLF